MRYFSGILIIFLLFSVYSGAQVKLYERTTSSDTVNTGLHFESSKRIKIDLNGKWQLSFDDGRSYSAVSVPLSYNFDGITLFKKSFELNSEIVSGYSFILIAEGIQYESEIKINSIYITKHFGGSSSIIIPIDENIIKEKNEILINVNSKLNQHNTLPFSDQVNYARTPGGINKDIYIVAVPKVYAFSNDFNITYEGTSSAKIVNDCLINTGNIDEIIKSGKDLTLKTRILKKSTGEEVASSDNVKFKPESFQSFKLANTVYIKNPQLWSPENPNLYIAEIIISGADSVIDIKNSELGLCIVKMKSDFLSLNGNDFVLKGINYCEDSYKFADALDYRESEQDLFKIKDAGFNCIRVPGKSAHPYIINLCNRIGLFIMQDVPVNEIPEKFLRNESYVNLCLNSIEEIVKRDNNNVSVICWGVGNNFDVTAASSQNYITKAKELVAQFDSRPVYYTTRNLDGDICLGLTDFTGINLEGLTAVKQKSIIEQLKIKKSGASAKSSYFIASYGISIVNSNRNGFSDIHSVESQSKFLTDTYKLVQKSFFASFISAYADWTSQRTLNYPLNENTYLKTEGIFEVTREPKQSAMLIKRLLNNQEIPKISEGNQPGEDSFVHAISGIAGIVLFVFVVSNVKRFKENILRCLIRPAAFFQYVKEQMLVFVYYNIILSLMISLGISIFISSLLFIYRENVYFDMLAANIFSGDSAKMFISGLSKNALESILFFTVLIFIKQLLVTLFLFFISMFTRGRTYFKNIYTISVWSSLPLLICLPIGAVIIKLSAGSFYYVNLSLYAFLIAVLLYIFRLISGARILFEINTFKAYSYGLIFVAALSGLFISYFFIFKSTFSLLSLIFSYS